MNQKFVTHNAHRPALFALLAVTCAVVLPLILTVCGCGSGSDGYSYGCTASVEPALRVYVTDATTGANIIYAAKVTAADGDFNQTLTPSESTGGDFPVLLSVGGAPERPGTYTVRVSEDGYSPVEQTVTVTKGDCHVNTQVLHISLTKQ